MTHMKITVEFYGRLKDQFIDWQTQSDTVITVYQELCTKYEQADQSSVIKPILDDTFCEWDQKLRDNDVIGFFPPAAGG